MGRECGWGRDTQGEVGETERERERRRRSRPMREEGMEETRVVKVAFWNMAGLRNKDEGFWKGIADWDIMVLLETWLEKKEWEAVRDKLPKDFEWEVQLARRKNKKGRAMGGMLMGIRKGVEVVEKEKGEEIEGIMVKMVKIMGEKWRILGVYANGDLEEKWGKVRGWIEDKEKGVRTILGGDLNARTGEMGGWWEGRNEIGEEEGRRSKDKKVNGEGRYLIDRLDETGWFIFNGNGKGDEEGDWTYSGGRGESVLDYIIGDEEGWERVTRVEVEDRVDSDHFPVVMWVIDKEGKFGRGSERRGKKWRWTEEGIREYRERVGRIWEDKGNGDRVEWRELREGIQGILEEGQGMEEGRGVRGWWDAECREHKKGVRSELRKWKRGRCEAGRYKEVKREYNKLCERKRREESDRWTEMARKAKTEEQVWKVVNGERKRRKRVNERIKMEEWLEYFKGLMGGVEGRVVRGARRERREDGETGITREEIGRAMRKIKEGKAAGVDGIPGEVWKYGGERMEEMIWEICDRVWRGEEWIEEWNEGLIVPIRKKGEGNRVEEYRGVTLTSTLYKVYATILGERLEREVKEKDLVPQNQTGFRKGMGTIDNIFVLNYLVNRQISRKGGKLVAFFVDLRAAFDSVDREVLEKALRERGIREGLIARCRDVLRETKNRVRVGSEVSEVFWTGKGVRQGCPLSPGLFNLLTADLEEYMEKGGWGGVRVRERKIYTLAYADDLVLIAEDEGSMKAMMARLERYTREKGLAVNEGKSKVMRFRKGGGRKAKISWRWEGKKIEEVGKIKYLGYVLQSSGRQDEHIRERVRMGMKVMGQVWGIGKRKFGGDWGRRLWLFDALVWTVVAYGVEIWGWKERERIERIQERFLKWLLGVGWRTPGYMVREELQRDKLRIRAGRRAWGFEERLADGRGSELARRCWEEMRQRVLRGGKLSRWETERQEFFEERGKDLGEMEREREEGRFEFGRVVEEDRVRQREERWERIRISKSNKWYKRVKGEGLPGYLKRGWAESRWLRIAKYRLGEGVKEGRYWEKEEKRVCRMCEREEETWEHVWEECGRWGTRGEWQEMVETVLGENGEGEKWLRRLERFREGRDWGEGSEEEGEGEEREGESEGEGEVVGGE